MMYTLILTMATIVFVSLATSEVDDDPKGIVLTKETFATSTVFKLGAYAVCLITAVIYCLFW